MRWEKDYAAALFDELEAQAEGEHPYAMQHVLLFLKQLILKGP